MNSPSIREKLVVISQMQKKDADNVIANILLKYYDENVFLSQKELADFCHTSISMITNFSKKLNYSGYRELLLRLKMEREYYVFQKRKIHNGLVNENLFLNSQNHSLKMLNQISDQESNLKTIIKTLKNAQKIFIFASYEQLKNAESFYNVLTLKNYDVVFSQYRKVYDFFVKNMTSKDVAFFLIGGLDNQTLVQYYNRLKNHNMDIVVISSASQEWKFNQPLAKITIPNSSSQEEFETARNIYINYILNTIIVNV